MNKIITKITNGTNIKINDVQYTCTGWSLMDGPFRLHNDIKIEFKESDGEEIIILSFDKDHLAMISNQLDPLAVFLTNE